MLILNRREGEELRFTDPEGRVVRVVVEEVHYRKVKFSIHAPEEIKVLRGELPAEAPAIPAHVRHDARRPIGGFPRRR
jgi:sRNA-binding carbon storage regulator CsrA